MLEGYNLGFEYATGTYVNFAKAQISSMPIAFWKFRKDLKNMVRT